MTSHDAPPGSPYRPVVAIAKPRLIARERRSWLLDGALVGLGAAAVVTAALQLGYAPLFLGFWALWLGGMRLVYHRGRQGVHRIHADVRGIRLQCSNAAFVQILSVLSPRGVDLFIPWDEVRAIEACPHQFGDDIEQALVITTATDTIAVRPGVFAGAPLDLARRLLDARERLALPPGDEP
jgi:hypothetical protein